jgi:hypothetical protein
MRRKRDETPQNELRKRKRRLRQKLRTAQELKLGKAIHFSQQHSGSQSVWPLRASALRPRKRTSAIAIPKIFSFIEAPEETIDVIDNLNAMLLHGDTRGLFVDHSQCTELDLCASLVMDTLIEQRRRTAPLNLSGVFSKVERVNIMLRASGLLERIHHPSSVLPAAMMDKIRKSPLYWGYSMFSERSTRCDEAATGLTEYFDKCLEQTGTSLSPLGKNRLSILISEAISNAEEHAVGKWYAKAHFDRLNPAEQEGGGCHLVLVNFSENSTIFNSFASHGASSSTFSDMMAYANRHLGIGIFQKPYDEESLCTLYALQEGVSSVSASRGTGTTNLIAFFLQLAGNKRKMCVLSGHSLITFDGKYALKAEPFEGGDRQVIAFNEENSLKLPPDGRYVRTLSKPFPGTLISLKFNLKETYASAV